MAEALRNVAKHAGATAVDVTCEIAAGVATVIVIDDGRGFDPTRNGAEGHYGLKGMQERAGEIDGALVLESTPGAGTRGMIDASTTKRFSTP